MTACVFTNANGINRLKLNYTYGTTANNGNVLTQTITVPTIGTATGFTATQSYTYDELNRLEVAQEANGTIWKQTFVYDRYGNRTFDTANTTNGYVSSNLTINTTSNRYNSGQGQILYDAAGNLTKDFSGHTFGYDAENHQTTYDNGATIAGGASYSYDGDGRRVKKVTGGITIQTTIFVYNALGQLVAEYDDSSQQGSGGTSYLTSDTLGTPRIITDSSGGVKARHDYLPFGEEIGLVGGRTAANGYVADDVRQKFTGKERDLEIGLDYFGARYYSSGQGRFTSTDPLYLEAKRLWDPQQYNLYSYTRNNPIIFSDPTGLDIEVNNTQSENYMKRLQANLSFKIALNDKNKVSIVDAKGKALGKKDLKALGKKLEGGEKELFNAITDTEHHVVIDTGNGKPNSSVFFGRFDGKGKQTLDFSDINLLDSPDNQGGYSAEQCVGHETIEAYNGAVTGATTFNEPHNFANQFPGFGGLGDTISSDFIYNDRGTHAVGGWEIMPVIGKPGVNVKITEQLMSPIPIETLRSGGAIPKRSSNIIKVNKEP